MKASGSLSTRQQSGTSRLAGCTVLRSEYSVARSHHSGSGSQKRHPWFWEAAPPQRGPKGFRQAADSDSEGA